MKSHRSTENSPLTSLLRTLPTTPLFYVSALGSVKALDVISLTISLIIWLASFSYYMENLKVIRGIHVQKFLDWLPYRHH
jgi:hypothetical protein